MRVNLRTSLRCCAVFFCGLLAGADASSIAYAATLTVTNALDNEFGSLRQVVRDANAGDTIEFDGALYDQAIKLNSEITLTKDLTIDGGLRTILDGRGLNRHFKVTSGNINIVNIVLQNGMSFESGGSIVVLDKVTININNSTITNNSSGSIGGAIASNGSLTITNSTINKNVAAGRGGGVYAIGDKLEITNSTISGNSSGDLGGGVLDFTASGAKVTNSTISGNSTKVNIAGIGVFSKNSTVINSNITENVAKSFGGGITFIDGDAARLMKGSLLMDNEGRNCQLGNGRATIDNYSSDGSCVGATLSSKIKLGPLADNDCKMLHATPDGPACVKTHAVLFGSADIDSQAPP